jgi:hypothetical protein
MAPRRGNRYANFLLATMGGRRRRLFCLDRRARRTRAMWMSLTLLAVSCWVKVDRGWDIANTRFGAIKIPTAQTTPRHPLQSRVASWPEPDRRWSCLPLEAGNRARQCGHNCGLRRWCKSICNPGNLETARSYLDQALRDNQPTASSDDE